MSKLSEPLKALINAAHARPHTIPAPRQIASVYEKIAAEAGAKKVGLPAWLTASTAATMTMNSPESLVELYRLATSPAHQPAAAAAAAHTTDNPRVYAAELMREVGLKCIGLNGVPRTINCLGAFHGSLPADVQAALARRRPRRSLTESSVGPAVARGRALWRSIYHPFTDKLTARLAVSHPDLPVHIIEAEYGALFADPPPPSPSPSPSSSSSSSPSAAASSSSGKEEGVQPPDIGRVLTSVMAVACLRAQGGVGPQVVSHVFGLRKAFEDGSADADGQVAVQGGEWLAGDEGSMWLIGLVDGIVAAIGGGRGSSFARGMEEGEGPRAKL